MALEIVILALTLSLILMLAMRRAIDGLSWPAWVTLDALSEHDVLRMRGALQGRARLVQATLAGVESERHAGDHAKAAALFRFSLTLVEEFAHDTCARLAEWGRAARALAAVYPLAALRVCAVRVQPVRRLVLAWRLLRLVPVTSAERYDLRIHMLQRALRALATFWRTAGGRARSGASADVSHDAATLAEAAGDTYEALVISRLTDEAQRRLPARDKHEVDAPRWMRRD